MRTRPLVIITTRLPPATCGIGTYSGILRAHWPDESRVVEFLVVDGVEATGVSPSGDRVTAFGNSSTRLARELDRIGEADLFLHYAGRAYHSLGFPFWLPAVLRRWKKKFPAGRLMIYFHELPGALPLVSRHHWLGKLSSSVARKLAAIADVLITNTEHHATKLRKLSGRADIQLIPVGSAIETAPGPPEARVRSEFVLFGLPFGRWQTLRLFENEIRRWIAAGRLTKLHVIGPGDDEFARQADDLMSRFANADVIIRHGVLASSDVASLLARSGFALTNATQETWSKSSAFMALAANECSVVITERNARDIPLSYAVGAAEVGAISEEELRSRSDKLAAWYKANADWPAAAKKMAALWSDQP